MRHRHEFDPRTLTCRCGRTAEQEALGIRRGMTRRVALKRAAAGMAALIVAPPPRLARPIPIPPELLTTSVTLDWVPCDGRALAHSQYPELGKVLGEKWGTAGPGTFRVPSYLGRALGSAKAGESVQIQLGSYYMKTSSTPVAGTPAVVHIAPAGTIYARTD